MRVVDQSKPVAVILGAGFAAVAGVPLASLKFPGRKDKNLNRFK